MPSMARIAGKNQKQILKILNREGQEIVRYRPAYRDVNDVEQAESTVTYQGYAAQMDTRRVPYMIEEGGASMDGTDPHQVFLPYDADIRQDDVLRFNGSEWRVSRWEPLKRGAYTIVQDVKVNWVRYLDA